MRQFLALIVICFSFFLSAQTQTEIGQQLEAGNAAQLTSYFNETIELEIPGSKGHFNKKQATIVLKDFFLKHPPTNYLKKHSGGGNNKALFEIGSLLTSEKRFRTYLLYNLIENKPQIIELRIELEE